MFRATLVKTVSVFALLTASSAASSQQRAAAAAPAEETYIYYYDELSRSQPVPLALRELRRNGEDEIFSACAAGQAEMAPILIPLALGLFKIFGNVVDAQLRAREQRDLAAMSRSSAGLRSDPRFPLTAAPVPQGGTHRPAFRCLVVDRVATVNGRMESRAVYVLGLRQLEDSGTSFTIVPLAGRVDSSPIFRRTSDKLNATVSLSFQSVVAGQTANQLSTLPAWSATFENLQRGQIVRPAASARRTSPVMPILPQTSATSVAAAVTEADVRLASETQRIALEQANRTLLISAMGDILKAAISD